MREKVLEQQRRESGVKREKERWWRKRRWEKGRGGGASRKGKSGMKNEERKWW